MRRTVLVSFILGILLILISCGGGGGGTTADEEGSTGVWDSSTWDGQDTWAD